MKCLFSKSFIINITSRCQETDFYLVIQFPNFLISTKSIHYWQFYTSMSYRSVLKFCNAVKGLVDESTLKPPSKTNLSDKLMSCSSSTTRIFFVRLLSLTSCCFRPRSLQGVIRKYVLFERVSVSGCCLSCDRGH